VTAPLIECTKEQDRSMIRRYEN